MHPRSPLLKSAAIFIGLRRRARRLARSRVLWSIAVLLLLYALGGFVLAPYLVERWLPSFAQEQLGRKAAVAEVRINPFALTFEASQFRLEGSGGKAMLAFDRLFVDFELSSLVRRAWMFGDIRLEGADLGLEIDRDGRLNLLEVVERLKKPSRPDDPPTRLIVSRLRVERSVVGLTDLTGATRASAVLTPVDIELADLSTLPDTQGRYTLQAKLPAGGAVRWKGNLTLEPIASSGEIVVQGMQIETAWRFVRDELGLVQPRGELSLAGRYEFTYREGQAALTMNGANAELSGLHLALNGEKEPLVAMRSISVGDAGFVLGKRELVIRKLRLSDGMLNAGISEGGVLDWQRIVAARAAPAAPPQPPAAPWRVRLADVAVDKVALTFTDFGRKPALKLRAAQLTAGLELDVVTGSAPDAGVLADAIRIELASLDASTPGVDAPYATLDALTLADGRIDTRERSARAKLVALTRGDLKLAVGRDRPLGLLQALSSPAPANAAPATSPAEAWRVQVAKVGVEKLALQYSDGARSPPLVARAGEVNGDFSVDAALGDGPARIVAADLQLGIDRLAVDTAGAAAALATLDSFRLAGGRVDIAERVLAAKTISMKGGAVALTRARDGRVALIDTLLAPGPTGPASEPASRPWRYRVDSFALERVAVALADRTLEPAIAYDVQLASISAKHIDGARKQPIAFNAALRVGERGTVSAEGTLDQDFGGAAARVAAAGIPLEPLQPVLAKHAALDLKSGQVGAKARITYRRAGEPALRALGQVYVENFLVNESASGDRFVAWKTLAGEGVALSLSPDRVSVRQVRVIEPGAKIVIARDRTINITHVIRKQPEAARTAPAAGAQPQAKAEEPPAFPYEIGTIRFENGTLDFADLSLVLPFATQVQALGGAIVGISSDPQARATLQLAGQVDRYGEARADGSLIPRDPEKFLDIKARFDNVDMPLLSPYAATFAGRRVAAGKLSLALEYKIVSSQLAGENRIVLRDFRLGERVQAPNALDLPLDLAVALLKDSEGTIRLAVPVSGNVGNPEFDYGKVIRGAIANVLTRVVTAPFRALAALFGKSDTDEVRTVRFAPGSDAIAPAQREQLDALAKALKERPQLTLVVRGPYDDVSDTRQLRNQQARRELARALRTKLQPGQDPGPIAYARADTQKALETLLTQNAGPDAVGQVAAAYAKRTGAQPDRVNPVLGLLGRGSKDTAFYEAVFERLVEVQPLADGAVRTLAEDRARAIVDTLAKAGVDRGRMRAGGIQQVKAGGRGVATELALEATAGAS